MPQTKNEDMWLELRDHPAIAACAKPDKAEYWISKLENGGHLRQTDIFALRGLLDALEYLKEDE